MAAAAVAAPAVVEPTQPHYDVKLFNRWSFDDVQVSGFYTIIYLILLKIVMTLFGGCLVLDTS